MSIADKIQSIENHIDAAYKGLDRFGADLTDVNKNINNISTTLDEIYEDTPKITEEGASLELSPTRKGAIKTELEGNTEQKSYEGYNLLDLTKCTPSACIINNDGTITSNINNFYYCELIFEYLNDFVLANKGNYLRFSFKEPKHTTSIVISGTNEDGSTYQEINSNSIQINSDFVTVTQVRLRFNRQSFSFTDTNSVFSDFQLILGSSDKDFEPYVRTDSQAQIQDSHSKLK